ncbi:TIGR00255 family protein [Peptoanaerobacter stomatis]|uniref:TIGR00255 family protein n=1 Tax=Peptoanaerobacter stomatis TaxID=796937 RepID=V9HTZ8_9FIRM|nr:YicC/YloC family endoribonuclease [Peptoanaerobacter stomatis]EHL16113.1 TIGR00255 family protein [Peptoanaerobacter stomatis]
MANSMTGFGRAVLNDIGSKVTVEIKSVNSRYLEIVSKMPRQLNYFEDSIKAIVNSKVSRGRLDIYIQVDNNSILDNYSIDEKKIHDYKVIFEKIQRELDIENDMKISSYLNLPEVMTKNSEPNKELENMVKNAVSLAMDNLCVMRNAEGQKIIKDLQKRVELLKVLIDKLELYTQDMLQSVFEKLQKRISELLAKNGVEADDARILQESAIYADKLNVTEEIVRFNTHISQLLSFLGEKEKEIGKKIDFLLQEMNREINTIGSKSQKTEIISLVVDIKAELEKIREQIQNIE